MQLNPSSSSEEIAQNLRTLLTTIKGEVYLDREYGIDAKLLDLPINVAKVRLTAEIARAIAKYEPRVELKACEFAHSDGILNVILKVVERNATI